MSGSPAPAVGLDHRGAVGAETVKKVRVLGEDPALPGLFYATGHFRNGILLTPVTADAVATSGPGVAPRRDEPRASRVIVA